MTHRVNDRLNFVKSYIAKCLGGRRAKGDHVLNVE